MFPSWVMEPHEAVVRDEPGAVGPCSLPSRTWCSGGRAGRCERRECRAGARDGRHDSRVARLETVFDASTTSLAMLQAQGGVNGMDAVKPCP